MSCRRCEETGIEVRMAWRSARSMSASAKLVPHSSARSASRAVDGRVSGTWATTVPQGSMIMLS